MLGARLHFLVAFFEIVLVDRRIFVGLGEVNDDLALKAFKDAGNSFVPTKAAI